MENRWGPSDKWEYAEEWQLREDLLDAVWDVKTVENVEAPMLQITRKLDWVDYGRMRGDPTAEKYYESLENVSIIETVTYHDQERKIDLPSRGRRREKSLAEYQAKDDSDPTGLPEDERRSDGSGLRLQKATMGPRSGA